jgi:hypothetical protein
MTWNIRVLTFDGQLFRRDFKQWNRYKLFAKTGLDV